MQGNSPTKTSSINFFILVGILVLCWIIGHFFNFNAEQFKAYFLQFPIFLSGLVYIILYVAMTFFIWFTKDLFMIAGAFVFDVVGSSVLVYISEVINAAILFQLSRKLGRGFVEQRTSGKFHNLDQRLGSVGFWDLFALRAVILIPFRFLDLGFGLTKVPFKRYMTAVLLGSPIRVLMRQYFLVLSFQLLRLDPTALVNYVQSNIYISVFSLIYLAALVFVFVRLKKIIWG